jgi:hypothetical protein
MIIMSRVLCLCLHEKLESLLLIKFHFDAEKIPCNGIYFLYEDGENSGGYGSGSSSQLLLRQFSDGTWNNVEHLPVE